MTEERGAIKMIKREIMITLAATVAAMTLVTGCGKKTTSMTEISRVVQVTKDSDENESSGDKALPTTDKETEKSTKESASEEKEAETSSGKDETDIKPAETSEKTDAKPAQSQTSKPAVNEQQTKPAANTPEKSGTKPAVNEQQTKPVQKPSQAVTQLATKAPAEPATTPVTKPAEPQTPAAPKVKTMWDAPYDVEGIKAYIIKELKARGYINSEEYFKPLLGDEYAEATPDNSAWDNYCTTTAGSQRYYDKVNHCAVGHQHYKWSEPFDGSIAENAEASTEWMVNHAIDYWDEIYGQHDYPYFSVYVEQFDDGCVIFYILAG